MQTQERAGVPMEAETRPHIADTCSPQAKKQARKEPFLEPSERVWPCHHLDFRCLGPRTVREYISGAIGCPGCGKFVRTAPGNEYPCKGQAPFLL